MIDEVYRTTQDILNKNGRGIISPARFLLLAAKEQTNIFCNVIDEYVAAKRNKTQLLTTEKYMLLRGVLDVVTETALLTRNVGGTIMSYHVMPSDYMMFGDLSVDHTPVELVESKDKSVIQRNQLISPSEETPMAYVEGHKITILPNSIGIIMDGNTPRLCDEATLTYYRYPKAPNWTYITIGGKAVFNPSDPNYQDFELPASMQTKLISGILKDFGVHLRDEIIVQYANSEDNTEYQRDNRQ